MMRILDEFGDLVRGIRRLGLPAIIAAFFFSGFAAFSYWVDRLDDVGKKEERECPVCQTQAVKMEGVCCLGFIVVYNPPEWSQVPGPAPKVVTPIKDEAVHLREKRYLKVKNRRECLDIASGWWLLAGVGFFVLTPVSAILISGWRAYRRSRGHRAIALSARKGSVTERNQPVGRDPTQS